MRTVILDSSVWVSLMVKDDVNHRMAKVILDKIESEKYKILIPNIIYIEVVTVLLKVYSLSLAEKFIVLNLKILNLEVSEFINFAFKLSKLIKTKTHDFLIIIYCLKYSVDVLETFDLRQRENYFLIKKYEEEIEN